MFKVSRAVLVLSALVAPVAAVHATITAAAPAACAAGGRDAALLVRVVGFKQNVGKLRVQVYGSDPAQFVKGGERVARIDVPVPRSGPAEVCVPLPAPGRYAVAVRHDMDADGKGGVDDGRRLLAQSRHIAGRCALAPDAALRGCRPHGRRRAPADHDRAQLSQGSLDPADRFGALDCNGVALSHGADRPPLKSPLDG